MPRNKLVVPQLFQFDQKGASIKGFLTSKSVQLIQGKTVGRYVIKNDEGIHIINGTVYLDEAMQQVELGEHLEIIYTHDTVAQSGYGVRQFDVYIGEDEVPDGKK